MRDRHNTMPVMSKAAKPEKGLRPIAVFKFILGSALLVLLIVWQDNGRKLVELLADFRWRYIMALLGVGVVMNLVSCGKWNLFLEERGIKAPLFQLFRLYLIGKFFNNFVPSMIGGDITRSYLLGRHIRSQSKSAASVFLERFTGLIAMITLALLFSVLNIPILGEPIIGVAVGAIVAGCGLFLLVLYKPGLVDDLGAVFGFIPLVGQALPKVRRVLADIGYFKTKYRILAVAMAYSFAFHILTSVNVYLCCRAIGLHASFLDVAVVTPIILLVVTIPVSPNNIGWWEWTFSVLLVNAGATTAQGLAVALILRAATFVFATVGGAFFLFERVEPAVAPD